MVSTRILCTDLAGLRAQALGLAEAAGLDAEIRNLVPRPPWDRFSPSLWPNPRRAVEGDAIVEPLPGILIGCGGAGARVVAALRRPGVKVVAVQHPRMALDKFDLVMAARHDGITGPNVVVTRTALHRVTLARLAAEKLLWAPRLAAQKRPLVAVLLGGSNGRYKLDQRVGATLAADLAGMARRDNVGVVVTPSRRTDPAVTALIREALAPFGGWVWDFTGENPYFGMLALADMVVVTQDSVSMISEASATAAPVMFAALPGSSRRQGIFLKTMMNEGRIRPFDGRFVQWPVSPLNDTPAAAEEMRRRLGL